MHLYRNLFYRNRTTARGGNNCVFSGLSTRTTTQQTISFVTDVRFGSVLKTERIVKLTRDNDRERRMWIHSYNIYNTLTARGNSAIACSIYHLGRKNSWERIILLECCNSVYKACSNCAQVRASWHFIRIVVVVDCPIQSIWSTDTFTLVMKYGRYKMIGIHRIVCIAANECRVSYEISSSSEWIFYENNVTIIYCSPCKSRVR